MTSSGWFRTQDGGRTSEHLKHMSALIVTINACALLIIKLECVHETINLSSIPLEWQDGNVKKTKNKKYKKIH